MSEYKSVVLTKLLSKPLQAGKVMKCDACIDENPIAVELAFFPDKLAEMTEGATIRAQFKEASGNYPASWFSVGKAKFQGKSGGGGGFGGGGGYKKNDAAIASMSALKAAVEYSTKNLPELKAKARRISAKVA
jgi:hypothetical protein